MEANYFLIKVIQIERRGGGVKKLKWQSSLPLKVDPYTLRVF